MKKSYLFILGVAVGALLMYSIIYVINITNQYSAQEQLRQKLFEKLSNELNEDQQIQYIEIKGRKGNTTLHTGMQKDSVEILLGKPDKINLDEISNNHYEIWKYNLKNENFTDLEIEYKNGLLTGVQEY